MALVGEGLREPSEFWELVSDRGGVVGGDNAACWGGCSTSGRESEPNDPLALAGPASGKASIAHSIYVGWSSITAI